MAITLIFIAGSLAAMMRQFHTYPNTQLSTGMDSMRESILGELDCKKTLDQIPIAKKGKLSVCNKSVTLISRGGQPITDAKNDIGHWKFRGYCSDDGFNVEASLVQTSMILFQKLQNKRIKLFPSEASPCRTPASAPTLSQTQTGR